MKRTICFLVAMLLLFSSCQTKRALLAQDYYREQALLEELSSAIESEDAEALVSLFSQKAINEADDPIAQVEQVFQDLPDGEVTWNDLASSSSGYDHDGEVLDEVMASYDLHIGEESYVAFMIRWESDHRVYGAEAREKLGIYTLRIVEESDYAEQYEQLHYSRMEIPGVYYKPSRLYGE